MGKLVPIAVDSIYGGPLPARLAKLAEDAAASLEQVKLGFATKHALFRLTDAYRDPAEQAKAHNDYVTGKKTSYSPPAGSSMHEAGRAIDVDLAALIHPGSVPAGYTLMDEGDVRNVLATHSWIAIANQGDPHSVDVKESWHFEFRGPFQKVYNETLSATKNHSQAYTAMAKAAIADLSKDTAEAEKPARRTLRKGDKGAEVVELQAALDMPLNQIDGDFGAKTEGFVFKFQIAHGLKADGIAGEKTLAALFKK
jgi:hypothetical protein